MTLRASKHKLNPTFGLVRSTLYKNSGIIILMCIAMLIFCPGFFLAILHNTTFRKTDYTSPDMLDLLYGVSAVSSCIMVGIGNYVNFAYLYKKSSSDVFHALPLTRVSLLFSRVSASFISVLVPVTLGYISLFVLSFIYPDYAVGTIAQIASAYLVNILLILAASAYTLFFIICAGSAFDLILSFAGFNIAVFVVGAIINTLCSSHLSGYDYSYAGIYKALSPVFYFANCGYMFADNGYVLSLSGKLIFDIVKCAAVFFILSAALYNFRKAERGEQAYAYKFIYIICGVLAGICGGYALSQIFVYGADTEEFGIIGIISFIAGALITTVVYGAVTERGFKTFKRSMAVGGFSVIAYGIIAVVVMTGAFGFENRIPSEDKINSATVSFDEVLVDYTDAGDALALHKAIIAKGADDDYKDIVDSPHTYVKIIYNLGGNDEFVRQYFVDKTKVKKELFAVYASDKRFDEIEKNIEKAYKRIELWGDKCNVDVYIDGQITKADAKNLISVYRRELNALGEEYFSVENQEYTVMDITLCIETTDSDEGSYGTYCYNIRTTSDFPETNEILSAFEQEDTDIKVKE